MNFIELLLKPVFQILDFTITIPVDFNGTTITFPLKLVFILVFIASLISVLWSNLVGTEHSD